MVEYSQHQPEVTMADEGHHRGFVGRETPARGGVSLGDTRSGTPNRGGWRGPERGTTRGRDAGRGRGGGQQGRRPDQEWTKNATRGRRRPVKSTLLSDSSSTDSDSDDDDDDDLLARLDVGKLGASLSKNQLEVIKVS